MVVTGATSHSTVHTGPSIASSTQFLGATSSRVGGDDDNIISDPSHSMTHAESSIAQSAQLVESGVQQRDDSSNNRVDPSDPAYSNPISGPTAMGAEPEVKCSQDLVSDTQSSAESQVGSEQFADLTQVPAIEQADVEQSEMEESQFQEPGCAGTSQHHSSRKRRSSSRSGDRTVEMSVEEYADLEQYRKSRRLERR